MIFPRDSIQRHRLANGLTVLVRRDTSAPVAAVVTYVKAGYFDETDDVAGIAHVLEHMFFKGTPSRGVGEVARETKAQGGYLNAHTIYDHTTYYAVVPSSGFTRALEIQADAYANSLIDAAELARELEVIIEEAKRKLDNPDAIATETLNELLFDRHRVRRWRIGREEGLRRLTRDDVVRFYRNFYRPKNTVLALVGDIDPAQTMRDVERLYGPLADGAVERVPGEQEVAPPGFRYRELSGDIAQTELAIGWRTTGTLHPDTPALDLAATLLGVGRASRLYRGVREQRLVTTVTSFHYTPTELGIFEVRADGEQAKMAEAIPAIWRELLDFRERGVTSEEVERVRRVQESRWLRGLESMDGQAMLLAEWEALGGWELADEYFGRCMSLGAAEIGDAVRRHLDPAQASILLYRPESTPPFAADADVVRRLLPTEPPPPREAPVPAPSAPHVSTPPLAPERVVAGVRVYRGANGLPVLVRPKPGAPITHIGVFAAGGAALEPGTLAGVATIAARVVPKGTERRSAVQIAEESELLGGTIGSTVTSDLTGWTLSVPTPRVSQALELLADAVQHAALPDDVIERERAVAIAQIAQLADDMYRYPLRLATEAAYAGHPYARASLGTEQSLAALRADDVRSWHAARLAGAPWVVAVCGDVDAGAVAAELLARFDALQLSDGAAVPDPRWPSGVVVRVDAREKAQTALALTFPGPGRRDAARFTARLAAGVASGLGGRFFETLRDRQSLCYTVQAYPSERVAGGMFTSYIATSPEKEDQAREGLLAEFARLADDPPSDEELGRAKTYMLGTHAIAQQSGASVLGEMIDAWANGEGLEDLETFESRVHRVTASDIRDLVRRYFDPGRRVEGIVRGRGGSA